jgi:hypothetical protein
MRNYLLRYHTGAGINLEQAISFNMPQGQKVLVQGDIREDERGVPVKFGIYLDVSCKAEDMDSAVNSTQEMVDSLVSLLSLSHQTWATPVMFVSGIDATLGLHDREFVQHFPLSVNIMPSRKYKNDDLSPIWDNLMKLKPDSWPRLLRAIRWYRKAMLESDALDQFMNLWTGLEALNELIKDKHDLPSEKPIRVCSKCGTPVAMEPTLAGTEYLVLRIEKLPLETWRSIRDTRTGLAHGFKDLSKLLEKAHGHIPDMQRALLLGIFHMLDIPEDIRVGLMREPLLDFTPPTMKVRVHLHELPSEKIFDGSVNPHLIMDTISETTKVEKDGRRSETRNIGLRMEGYQGKWTPIMGEVYGKKLPDDLKWEFTLVA